MEPHTAATADRPSPTPRTRRLLPDRVVVVADLHLGEGIDPVTGPVSGENFFYDREFETWLDQLIERAAIRGRRFELILNGDVFDFLRVVRLPESPGEVAEWGRLLTAVGARYARADLQRAARAGYTRRERRYGYGTQEHKCIWKLWVIARGHAAVFRALARWCRAGHSLVVIRGNHDLEWVWPGVRRALRVLLGRAGSGRLSPGQLRFRSRFYRRANLHVEHGHRAQWFARADRDFAKGKPARLHLPYGSLVSRYWLNVLERGIALGVRSPASVRLKRILRRQPWRVWWPALTSGIRAVPLLGVSGWKTWFGRVMKWWPARLGGALGAALLALPQLSPAIAERLPFRSLVARTGVALLAQAVVQLGFAAREIADQVSGNRAAAQARRYALRAAVRWHRPGAPLPQYVILGHTHRTDVCELTTGDRRVVYLNPGAWLPHGDEGGDDRDRDGAGAVASFLWLARRGGSYVRHRVMTFDPATNRCHVRSTN